MRKLCLLVGALAVNSKLPEPMGLLKSTDGGKICKKVSLQGKVDYHLLEVSNKEVYGGDSGSGTMFYYKDQGKSWSDQGKNTHSDIAPNPKVIGSALALRAGVIHQSSDAFKTTQVIPFKTKVTGIEWKSKRLLASSGVDLLISKDLGKTWKVLSTFLRISRCSHNQESWWLSQPVRRSLPRQIMENCFKPNNSLVIQCKSQEIHRAKA